MAAERIMKRVGGGGNYFATPKTDLQFISSGCLTLDLALGGGWAEQRIANIVGDKSTGKTLLCIEAAANFVLKYPTKSRVLYRECEAAFDPNYAKALGMPLDQVDFGNPLETVEDLFEDMQGVLSKVKWPTLYIVDSLDSLSDRAEMERDMDQGSYGTAKAKNMSQMFRRLTRAMAASKVTLIIVSQVRSKIGISFGRNVTRSGGRALDFYASQVVYLNHLGAIKRKIHGMVRSTGIKIKAKCDKNKIALPFRESEFEISFGYGIDDAAACLSWLKEARFLKDVSVPDAGIKDYLRELSHKPRSEYQRELDKLHKAVTARWYEIESSFLPTRKKYGA